MNNQSVSNMFPSYATLRIAHTELLKITREESDNVMLRNRMQMLIHSGVQTGAMLDKDDERQSAQTMLDYWASLLYRQGIEPPDATLVDFDPLLAPELPDALCPYVGLEAFDESTAKVFFGRKELIKKCCELLTNQRLLSIVSDSGSGKSSLVLGGLLPALQTGAIEGSDQWYYLPRLVPGSDPLANLARVLRPQNASSQWVAEQAALMRADPAHGIHLVNLLSDQPTALFVDQFEELWTLCDDNTMREAFVTAILALLDVSTPRHRVIITLRSDFEGRLVQLPELNSRMEAQQVRVMALNAVELREAIEQPANLVGLKFADGIVDDLVRSVLGEPAGLPLLQFTLLKLWEARQRNRITWETYQRLGGVREALTRSADEFYASLLPEEQQTAKRILLQMVRPGAGLEVTSRRVRRESIYAMGEAPERIERVIEKLLQARLIRLTIGDTSADDQLEVAHEALVRNWRQLIVWINEERTDLDRRRRLDIKATEWVSFGRGADGLLDAKQLAQAEEWIDSPQSRYLGFDAALPDLVAASRKALQAAELERQHAEQQERDLEKAQLRADLEARSKRRLQKWVFITAVVTVLAIFSAIFAFINWRTATKAEATAIVDRNAAEMSAAEAQSAKATAVANRNAAVASEDRAQASSERAMTAEQTSYARYLVAQGQSIFESNPLQGLGLALEGLALVPTNDSQTQTTLLTMTTQLAAHGRIRLLTETGQDTFESSNGAVFVLDSIDTNDDLRETATGRVIAPLSGQLNRVAFSPDGTLFIVDYKNAPPELRRTDGNTVVRQLAGSITDIAFSPNGTVALINYTDKPAELRRTQDGMSIITFTNTLDSGIFNAAIFSPDSTVFVVRYTDAPPELRRTTTGQIIAMLSGGPANISFNPNSTAFIVRFAAAPLELRSTNDGSLLTIFGSRIPITVEFSPDGSTFVATYPNALPELQRVSDGTTITTLPENIYGVTFSPSGKTVIVSYSTARPSDLRNTDTGTVITLLTGRGISIFFAPNDTTFMIDYNDSLPSELRQGSDGKLLRSFSDRSSGAEFSPDGDVVWIRGMRSELRDNNGDVLTDLGLGVTDIIVNSRTRRAIVHYFSGSVYLLDLAWLRAMGGSPAALSLEELTRLACTGPLASELWTAEDQTAIDVALDGRASQACR